jgi:hypothetical protein
MAKGVAEDVAEAQAKQLAERYLFRETLGKATDAPLFVRALDSLGQLALQGRKLPVVGEVWGWFVPFIRTPINIAKFGVERSPLGFIGAKTDEHKAHAMFGSLITTIGAILALQDKTTWAPPRDPEEKQAFYASGRIPYAVQILGKWVPMQYLGPYAYALALPAALKHFQKDTRTALTDGDIKQITEGIISITRFITSQTPLTGMSNFLSVLEGDIDYTIPQVMGFTAEQIIPLSGLVRYINTILDPVYRKAPTFVEAIKRDIPIL